LEDNGISYDKIITESEQTIKKANNLKLKLEKEIEKLNNSHKKINEEISLSFKKRHLELDEEEKKLKLELNTKVNRTKEELNDLLLKLPKIVSSCERTNEALESYEINNDEIQSLYLISMIHKNEEKAYEFLKKKIYNLNISMNYRYTEPTYETYYFNGIPIPKDIKTELIEEKLHISWDLDDSIIKDIENKNIKFYIFIKFGSFDDIYEANNKYFDYKYFTLGNNYEIKVRTWMDNCYSDWSESKNIIYEDESD